MGNGTEFDVEIDAIDEDAYQNLIPLPPDLVVVEPHSDKWDTKGCGEPVDAIDRLLL
jgi:hypothetical protein